MVAIPANRIILSSLVYLHFFLICLHTWKNTYSRSLTQFYEGLYLKLYICNLLTLKFLNICNILKVSSELRRLKYDRFLSHLIRIAFKPISSVNIFRIKNVCFIEFVIALGINLWGYIINMCCICCSNTIYIHLGVKLKTLTTVRA